MHNLPNWVDVEPTTEEIQQLITALPYDVYVEIERDLRSNQNFRDIAIALVLIATVPVPKGVDRNTYNSMRLAQITKIITNFATDLHEGKI